MLTVQPQILSFLQPKDKEAQHLACLQSHPCPEISENLVFE
jgi:hypothetical protein